MPAFNPAYARWMAQLPTKQGQASDLTPKEKTDRINRTDELMENYSMAKKTTQGNHIFSIDAGNGGIKFTSSETVGTIQFEPLVAPMTDRKGMAGDDNHPRFSLREGDKVLVFGIDDVFQHGRRDLMRRLNSSERYTSGDYFRMLKVAFLHAFADQRGKGKIKAEGVISIPVAQYNQPEVVKEIREALLGAHRLEDEYGCILEMEIGVDDLILFPEGTGTMFHRAYDAKTLKKRQNVNIAGSTVIIDIGFETTNLVGFEGMQYQRDRAVTLPRSGMGVIVRHLADGLKGNLRDVDTSRVDRALRVIAGTKPGAKKIIEIAPGIMADVTDDYDIAVVDLASKIADGLLTRYTEDFNRAVLAGGGAHHLEAALRERLPFEVEIAPDAEISNLMGAYTALNIRMAGR